MTLENWLKNGWLTEHKPTKREIADLLAIVDRDLQECQIAGLSPEWRLNIAYNAALQAATAALAACGYRAAKDAHHFRVIQGLAYTIGAESSLIQQFQGFRKKRNISAYERMGTISEHEAKEMVVLAKDLRNKVVKWLASNYPQLL